jgi:hypothetical protein
LVTGSDKYMPTGIPALTLVKCSKFFVPTTTFVTMGTDNCPPNWTLLYKGFSFGDYYNHTGGGTKTLCLNSEQFDSGNKLISGNNYSYIYGTMLSEGPVIQLGDTHDIKRFVKCGVCAKN